MMDQLHFLRPDWFYVLIPFTLLLFFAFNHTLNSLGWKKICDAALLPHILIAKQTKTSRLPFIFTAFAILLCIIAAAGPVWKKLPTPVFRDQSSLVIAVDLSRSMDASDVKPTRLKRAKLKLIDILKQRKGGQTALIVYAANAFTVTPLTSDTATIANLITALDSAMMPAQGSNAADALNLSTSLLSQSGVAQGDVLLITDGVKQQDFFAITALASKGHRLSILGVGTPDGGPIVLKSGFLTDIKGNIVIPKLDVPSLQKAALLGNGLFVGMQANDDDIEQLTALYARNRTQTESAEMELSADIWYEEGPWLLLIVLALVALLSRRGVLILVTALILPMPEPAYALNTNELWLNANQRAMQHFEKGEHNDAALLFKQNNWKASAHYRNGEYEKAIDSLADSDKKPSSDVLYNKANALAKLERYQEAIEAYDEAVSLNPMNEDAIYNRELVTKKLQEQQPQKNQEQEQEKDENRADKNNKDDQKASEEEGEKSEDEKSQDGYQADQESDNDKKDKQSNKTADNEDKQETQPEPKDNKEEEQTKKNNENLAQNLQQEDDLESSEEKKATEQWLKRIVDDPGGLLRRKFKYQYQNMPGHKQSQQPW